MLLLACAHGFTAEPEKKPSAVQLTAEFKSYSELSYRVINNSDKPVTLGIMFCSKMENWSTDLSAVKIVWPGFRGCDKDVCQAHTLKKGETLTGALQVQFLVGGKNNGLFRLHFKSCSGMGLNEQKLNVVRELWSEQIKMSSAANHRIERPAAR